MNDLNKWRLNLLNAVEAQINDETLWTMKPTIGEAYLQQSLRWLHYVIEENSEEALLNIIQQSTGDI